METDSLSTILLDVLLPHILWMLTALLHHLTSNFFEDDHLELLRSDLLENEKVTNMQLMSNGKCCPPTIKACFTIEISQGDCPDATCVCP